jgi:hypothetical protein
MTWIVGTMKHRLSAKLAGGIAVAAVLALGAFAPAANAAWHDDHRGHGYYGAPPVVYGSPYYGNGYYGGGYYAPPVVYGPGIGIGLPGVSIGIR